MLARGSDVWGVNEPDNENWQSAARHAKKGLGRFPTLAPGENAERYRRFWEWALTGAQPSRRDHVVHRILGPRAYKRLYRASFDPVPWLGWSLAQDPEPPKQHPQRVIVKSVHAELAIDWIASTFDVEVLVVSRHPADVLASWIEMDLKEGEGWAKIPLESRAEAGDGPWGVPPPGPSRIERMCWRIGLLHAVLEESAARHPEWHRRTHERLCSDPGHEFGQLYEELGLTWTDQTDAYLQAQNEPGSGFEVKRQAADLPGAWRHRLDDHQIDVLRKTLAQFPIAWTDADFERDTDVEH